MEDVLVLSHALMLLIGVLLGWIARREMQQNMEADEDAGSAIGQADLSDLEGGADGEEDGKECDWLDPRR